MTAMIEVTQEDANNYCLVLKALGMEEEGDPVSAIEMLRSWEAEKAARHLNHAGPGLLQGLPERNGQGCASDRVGTGPRGACDGLAPPVCNINEMGDVSLANEGETAEVCDLVQTGECSQTSAVIGDSESGRTDTENTSRQRQSVVVLRGVRAPRHRVTDGLRDWRLAAPAPNAT